MKRGGSRWKSSRKGSPKQSSRWPSKKSRGSARRRSRRQRRDGMKRAMKRKQLRKTKTMLRMRLFGQRWCGARRESRKQAEAKTRKNRHKRRTRPPTLPMQPCHLKEAQKPAPRSARRNRRPSHRSEVLLLTSQAMRLAAWRKLRSEVVVARRQVRKRRATRTRGNPPKVEMRRRTPKEEAGAAGKQATTEGSQPSARRESTSFLIGVMTWRNQMR
mmetsp:Transcript_44900/g.103872  ORF Transcript_44900/g.103872 Transcript_44900/m.103872 type:complete len:216 (-) Transcript_44900:1308-1955(-)